MTDYEYSIEDNWHRDPEKIPSQLNLYGRTGWRLVFITESERYIYERELDFDGG